MVNAAAAIDTGSSSLSLFQRAATVDAVSSSETSVAAPSQETARVTNLGQTLRYNSFEFSYRQDFGKIVLLRQEPETGEVVQQFPTDYYLKRYAESQRASREPQVANESGTPDAAPAQNGAQAEPVAVGAGAPTPAIVAPVVASAPVISSAPALPSGGVGGSIGAGVDITI